MKLIVWMLVIFIRMLVLPTNTADCERVLFFYFYEKVQHSFALKLKNSFYQCHAGWAKKHSRLRGDGIKNNKQPLHNNKQAIEEVIFVNTDMLSSG